MEASKMSAQQSNTISADWPPKISVVVPIYNEVDSIPQLIEAISSTFKPTNTTYEIICVDDGSKDGSRQLLKDIAEQRTDLRAILLRRNYGQTPAMAAGFEYARGEIIVTMDGDLQNDPTDIPRAIAKLEEGYDLVSGWRQKRQDDALTRLLPSKIANWIIRGVTDVQLHDYGCSLKAYRREIVADMNLYGELHRFLPALASIEGAKITEIPVLHHPRKYGKSKYGLSRTFRVILDLMTIFFMKKFLTRPMHVFGLFGILSMFLGTALGLYLTFLKLGLGQAIGQRPLLMLAVLLLLTGIQLFCLGILAEIMMRTYHESQNRPIYRVREIVDSTVKTYPAKTQ
jgi:dolichol-phosphate mannosyltransferase